MIKNNFIFFIFALSVLLQLQLKAQSYKGKLINNNDKLAIAYVNIGIVGKNIGTVSNITGDFSISLPETYNNDSLRFSILGYIPKSYKVADFKKQFTNNDIIIVLETKLLELNTVVIKPQKSKIIGNENKSKKMVGGFSSNDLGSEVGTVMKIKKAPTLIENVSFNIAYNKYGNLIFRLNIYDLKDGKPNQSILKENVFVKTNIKNGTVTVDLSSYSLIVNDDFFVSLEWIENLGENGLCFPVGILNSPSFSRKTSQGYWKKVPVGIAIYSKVRYNE